MAFSLLSKKKESSSSSLEVISRVRANNSTAVSSPSIEPVKYTVPVGATVKIGRVSIDVVDIQRVPTSQSFEDGFYRCRLNIEAPLSVHIVRKEIDDGEVKIKASDSKGKQGCVWISRYTDLPDYASFRIGGIHVKVLAESSEEIVVLEIINPTTSPIVITMDGKDGYDALKAMIAKKREILKRPVVVGIDGDTRIGKTIFSNTFWLINLIISL